MGHQDAAKVETRARGRKRYLDGGFPLATASISLANFFISVWGRRLPFFKPHCTETWALANFIFGHSSSANERTALQPSPLANFFIFLHWVAYFTLVQ
ncbi:MAG: hypothetical protein KME03_08855 [Aphanocapsa lilacina HA4352-LM1]|jgi:hypothetical protein|nr:hypothetical protein [Aphanocapsa lilacina HA4352-LM1]